MAIACDFAPERVRSLERVVEPSLEDRLSLMEERFLRRVADGMPLPQTGIQAREANEVALGLVSDAFAGWFAPQRALFLRAWVHHEDSGELIEGVYRDFLETIGLRRGARVSSGDDTWEALDGQIETAAEAFRCAMQQQDGWIEQYGVLPTRGEDGRYERRAYLQVANMARGFLGVRGTRTEERSRLANVDLEDANGCVLPRGRDRGVYDLVREECLSAYQAGQDSRVMYEERLQAAAVQGADRRAFGEVLHSALQQLEGTTLLGPHLFPSVRRCAEFVVELETRRQALLQEQAQATTVDERKSADERLEMLERKRADAREALGKARTLLRLFQEAVRLDLILPEERGKMVQLKQLATRLL